MGLTQCPRCGTDHLINANHAVPHIGREPVAFPNPDDALVEACEAAISQHGRDAVVCSWCRHYGDRSLIHDSPAFSAKKFKRSLPDDVLHLRDIREAKTHPGVRSIQSWAYNQIDVVTVNDFIHRFKLEFSAEWKGLVSRKDVDGKDTSFFKNRVNWVYDRHFRS